MRSDLLSKRIFYAGCCGLPWLWIVHVLYHYKQSVDEENDQALLNPDDREYFFMIAQVMLLLL
jgi:hypothetical protein